MTGAVRSADGVTVRYDVHGRGLPALVLVHGWSCDRGYWRHQVPHFAAERTVVTVDLAGHGESGTAGRNAWTMPSFGDDVAAAVDHLGLRDLGLPAVAINPAEPPSDRASLARHGVTLSPVPGVGHFLMLEDPAAVSRAIGEAIASFPGPPGAS